MNRRKSIAILAMLGASVPLGAFAQKPERLRRVAYLGSSTADSDQPRLAAFRRAMNGFGYVEGRNYVIDLRYAGGKPEPVPALVIELLRLDPDVIVTNASPATAAAKNATRSIPIVFSGVADPVAFGFVDSLRRPGGNVTGVTNIVAVTSGKRLQLLKQAVPAITMVGVLLEPHTPVSVQQWKESQLPARELGLRLHPMQISGADGYDAAFAEAAKAGVTAVAASVSATAFSNQSRIVGLAAKHRMPAIYARSQFVDAGGLMSYGSSTVTDGKDVARFVDRIFKGAKPEDLPVEQPTEFELVINKKTARQLGLTIPSSLLLRADRVIE